MYLSVFTLALIYISRSTDYLLKFIPLYLSQSNLFVCITLALFYLSICKLYIPIHPPNTFTKSICPSLLLFRIFISQSINDLSQSILLYLSRSKLSVYINLYAHLNTSRSINYIWYIPMYLFVAFPVQCTRLYHYISRSINYLSQFVHFYLIILYDRNGNWSLNILSTRFILTFTIYPSVQPFPPFHPSVLHFLSPFLCTCSLYTPIYFSWLL